jgi:hypothetical protein
MREDGPPPADRIAVRETPAFIEVTLPGAWSGDPLAFLSLASAPDRFRPVPGGIEDALVPGRPVLRPVPGGWQVLDRERAPAYAELVLFRWAFSRLQPPPLLFHAGAVAHDGRAAILCGPTGAGKSTLSRTCAVAAGLDYLSDEVAPLLAATGVVLPYPRTPGLRSGGSGLSALSLAGDRKTLRSDGLEGRSGGPCVASLLLLLSGFEARTGVEPLPPRQALLEVLPLVGGGATGAAGRMSELAGALGRMRLFRMRAGPPDEAAVAVRRLLAEAA